MYSFFIQGKSDKFILFKILYKMEIVKTLILGKNGKLNLK